MSIFSRIFRRKSTPQNVAPPHPNLKPCPHCLGEQGKLRLIEVSGWLVHQCHWCLAAGPYSLHGADSSNPIIDAVRAWNHRRNKD